MRATVLLIAALFCVPPVWAFDISYSDDAATDISDEDLIIRWTMSDEACRGTSGAEIAMWEACGLREAYTVLVMGRGYCMYGPTVTHNWERCKE